MLQDTLYLHYGKQYLKDCYIEGSVDFIFGNSTALLEHCHIHCKTAQSRNSPQEKTGYVFLRCVIMSSIYNLIFFQHILVIITCSTRSETFPKHHAFPTIMWIEGKIIVTLTFFESHTTFFVSPGLFIYFYQSYCFLVNFLLFCLSQYLFVVQIIFLQLSSPLSLRLGIELSISTFCYWLRNKHTFLMFWTFFFSLYYKYFLVSLQMCCHR